ncbi:zinc finger BED domain-containing protein RICESLEEPER 2-like protein [Tanacetum coccineum]
MFEHGDENKMMAWKFDQKESKKALARMVIVDELPFSFVERDGFRHYSRINQPLFDVPCRATTTTDCYKLYDEEKIKLLDVIQKNIGRICLTTDSWTSLGKKSYMALTGYFIDNEWKLKKKILNFCRLDGHSGVDIGKGVESCVNEWGIDAILAISVDNASANDTALDFLRKTFAKKDKVMKKKFDKYYGEIENMNVLPYFALLLDPRNKDEFLNIVVDDHYGMEGLAMWKVNSPRFPIVSLMARDLLAIPVSTVAFESVFSTSGRVLDSFRSSLSDKSIENLICTQDWLRKVKDKIPEEEEDCETIIIDSSEDEGTSSKRNVNGNESFIIED